MNLKVLGVITAAVGFIGKLVADQVLEDNPVESIASSFFDALGAGEQVSADMQLWLFFADYGVYIGLVGIVLLVLGVLAKGK